MERIFVAVHLLVLVRAENAVASCCSESFSIADSEGNRLFQVSAVPETCSCKGLLYSDTDVGTANVTMRSLAARVQNLEDLLAQQIMINRDLQEALSILNTLPTVTSVSPDRMNVFEDSITVRIHGNNLPTNREYMCWFGQYSSIATWSESSSGLQCSVPMQNISVVPFNLTMDGVDVYSPQALNFTYHGVTCATPSLPTNGASWSLSNGNTYPTRATLNCAAGYTATSASPVACTTNGTFSSLPTCQGVVCLLPSLPTGGLSWTYAGGSERYPTNITLTCNAGYTVSSSNAFACSTSGTFPSLPTCNSEFGVACLTDGDCSGLKCTTISVGVKQCLGPLDFPCTSHTDCQPDLGGCNPSGQSCGNFASCQAIKSATVTTLSSVYSLRLSNGSQASFYCDMATPGEGWTLVWNNVLGGSGKPMTNLSWSNAINGVYSHRTISGISPPANASIIEKTITYTGLAFWAGLSPVGRLRYDWTYNYGIPVPFSWDTAYSLTPSMWEITFGSGFNRAGPAVAPGLVSYSNGKKFSTYDVDQDGYSGSCSVVFSNTPWWYDSCWMGSINGGGELYALPSSQGVPRCAGSPGYCQNGAYYYAFEDTLGDSTGNGGGNGWCVTHDLCAIVSKKVPVSAESCIPVGCI